MKLKLKLRVLLGGIFISLLLAGVANAAVVVQKGDMLWNLFGIDWKEIAVLNGITDPTKLQIGTVLETPGTTYINPSKPMGGVPNVDMKYVQSQYYSLAGAGVALGGTSVTLQTFTLIDGTKLSMSNFGVKGFGTIDPGNGTKEEQIVFTGVTQNSNGTATLTGVSRVLTVYPYTETSGLAMTHTGGTRFVISNTAGFYNTFANKWNDETVSGTWTFVTPFYYSSYVPATDPLQVIIKADLDAAISPTSYWLKSGSDLYYVAGNISIGTTTPFAGNSLTVAGAVNILAGSQLNWGYASDTSITGGTALAMAFKTNSQGYTFSNGATNALTILGTGKVGINSSTPGYYLSVNGDMRVTGTTTFDAIPTIPTTAPTVAGQVVALDNSAKLPAMDASQLTKLPLVFISSSTFSGSSTTAQFSATTTISAIAKNVIVTARTWSLDGGTYKENQNSQVILIPGVIDNVTSTSNYSGGDAETGFVASISGTTITIKTIGLTYGGGRVAYITGKVYSTY